MAIKCNFHTNFGFEAVDSYVKIESFSGDKSVVRYRVRVFANEEARTNAAQPLHTLDFECALPNGDVLPALYANLKTYELFASAVDA